METLEGRTLLASTVGVTAGGAVSVAVSASGTVQLSFDSVTDTYTFQDSNGVSSGVVNAAFTYVQGGSADSATLEPVNQATQDFTSVGYTQSAAAIIFDLNSLNQPTTITNEASSDDIVTVGNSTNGLLGVNAAVALNNSAAGAVSSLTVQNTGGKLPTSTLTATSFTTFAPVGIGAIDWTSGTLASLGVDSAVGGNLFDAVTTAGAITTTFNTGAGSNTEVQATGAGSTLDIDGQGAGNVVTLGFGGNRQSFERHDHH